MMACFRAEDVARMIVDSDQDSDDYSDIEEDPQFPLPRLEDYDDPDPQDDSRVIPQTEADRRREKLDALHLSPSPSLPQSR